MANNLNFRLLLDAKQYRAELDSSTAKTEQFGAQAQAQAVRTTSAMQAITGAAAGLAAAFASIQTVKAVASMADTWSDLTSRVRLNIDASEDAAEVMDRLAAIARGTYSSVDLTVESFARNAVTLNALGKSTQEQLDYTEALNNALVVSGAKADAAAMVQDNLAKAMATGTLSGIELNNVLFRGSRIAELLAEELGTNVTGLRELGTQGKITGDVIYSALVKNMEALSAEAESMPATIEDGFTLLRNSVLQTVGVFDQQNEVSQSVAEGLVAVADNMGTVIKAGSLLAGALVVAHTTSAIATKAHEMATRRAAAAALAEAEAQLKNLQAKGAGIAGTAQLTAAENALAAAQTRAAAAGVGQAGALAGLGKGLLALAGGPIGVVVLGVTALGAALWSITSPSAAAKDALAKLRGEIESSEAAYQALQESARGTAQGHVAALVGYRNTQDQLHQLRTGLEAARIAQDDLVASGQVFAGIGGSYYATLELKARRAAEMIEDLTQAQNDAIRANLRHAGAVDELAAAEGRSSDSVRQAVDAYLRAGVEFDTLEGILKSLGIEQAYWLSLINQTPPALAAARAASTAYADGLREQLATIGLSQKQMVLYKAGLEAVKAESPQAAAEIQRLALQVVGKMEAEEAASKAAKRHAKTIADGKAQAEAYTAALRDHARTLIELEGHTSDLASAESSYKLAVMDAIEKANEQVKVGMAWVDVERQLAASIAAATSTLGEQTVAIEHELDVLGRLGKSYQERIRLAAMTEDQRRIEEASLQAIAEWERAHKTAIDATTEAMLRKAVVSGETSLKIAEEARRAAEQSTRAWEDFSYGLADAVLDGSKGVKTYFKRLLDDLKKQLLASGLLNLFKQIFNLQGANSSGFTSLFGAMAGGHAGIGFGSLLQLAGGLSGGTGGGLLSGLAGAISSGVSGGLISLGGTLAGGGGLLGGLGMGLMQSGGFINQYGLLGGLGKGLTGGLSTMFGGGGFLSGLGQMIPAIAAIAGVAAAIQKISGGKLFGTSYGFDSAGRTLDFSATGASGQDRVTEVRQRSLFRGRQWRDTYSDLPGDVADAIGQFWDEVAASNIAIAGDAARTVGAQIRQEFDRDGNVTSTIVEVIGRQWRESLEEAMTRIAAENTIANIDAMLGTTVQRAIGGGPGGPGVGGGGGGGSRRRGDDYDQLASLGGAVPLDVQAQVGEASAIAERWRHDAELLAEGAQFLLLAATDIRASAGLLGEGGTLTQITALIEDLQASGESLSEAYVRVATSAALLDQALALSGVQIEGTREYLVRLATDITTAAGGLERASALWSNYFDRFYSDAERAQFALTQAQASATREFSDIGLNAADFEGADGMAAFRELFESQMASLSAEAIVEWLEAAAALGIVIDATDALNAALGEVGEVITTASQTADQLAAVNDILDGNAWDLALAGMTDAEAAIARINHQYDQQRAELLANAATLEQLTTLESQRAQALANQQAAMLAQRASITGNMQRDIDRLGMTDYEREVAGIHAQRQDYIDSLVATGMSLVQATIATREWRDAMLGAAAAAEAARQQQLLAQRASITGNLQRDIDQLGMTDYEREVAGIHAQRQDYIDSLVATGMSLVQATKATREWRDAMLGAAAAAEAARQQQLLAQRASITGNMQRDIDRLGMTDYEREVAGIHAQRQDYIDSLVATGMSLVQATIATREWRDAMLGAAAAQREAARAAAVQGILQPILDDAAQMQIALSEMGMSQYARDQARIARETQDALARATAAGATAAELLAIEIAGLERASLSAALAMAGFAAELEGWEFEDYLAGLSDFDAQRARLDQQWQARYDQAVQLFGAASSEAARVLGLWDSAIARHAQSVVAATAEIGAATSVSMGQILERVRSFKEELMQEIAHFRVDDAIDAWLSELTGLPRAIEQGAKLSLRDAVQEVQRNYAQQMQDLQDAYDAAWQRYLATPWQDQARIEQYQRQITAIEEVMAAMEGGLERALERLQSMYLASLQGVRDYLDSMLLDPNLSTLSPAEQLDEAWRQLQAAVEAGEGDAATRLADVYLNLLRQFEASGDDYNTGWQAVRDLLEGMFDFDIADLLDPADAAAHVAEQQLAAADIANDWLAQIAANTAGVYLPPGGIPAYASGGWINGPTTLLAGERGRELILPNPVSEFFSRVGIPVVNTSGGNNAAVVERLDRVVERLDAIERGNVQGHRHTAETVAAGDVQAQQQREAIARRSEGANRSNRYG